MLAPGDQVIDASMESALIDTPARDGMGGNGLAVKIACWPAISEMTLGPDPLSGISNASNSASHSNSIGVLEIDARRPALSFCGSAGLPDVWLFQAASSMSIGPIVAKLTFHGSSRVPVPLTTLAMS